MHHALIEGDEGWLTLIAGVGLGIIMLGLAFGCLGLYRLKQRMWRNRT